jgi:hypothetical protein
MFISKEKKLTFSHHFLKPGNASHRQYEALRAYFVEGLPSAEAAARFGYTSGSFRTLVHQFRQHPEWPFFAPTTAEAEQAQRHDEQTQRVVALRKQNLSIYDISQAFLHEGRSLSPVAVDNILKQQGFAGSSAFRCNSEDFEVSLDSWHWLDWRWARAAWWKRAAARIPRGHGRHGTSDHRRRSSTGYYHHRL